MRLLGFLVLLQFLSCTSTVFAAEQYDVVIRNGRIVDGTGAPWYAADLAIHNGRIAAMGRLEGADAKQTLDAAGLIVAPGFIDMMGQTASPCLESPAAAMNLLTQGVTTINAGEGISAAPLDAEAARAAGWSTMAEYFALIDKAGLPINCVQTVGHTQVRRVVLGDVDRRPSPDELARMKALVEEAMQAGAIGVSTALIYPPAVYASTEEVTELAKVAGNYGGGYYTHMRNEGDRLLEAIDEALAIGRAAGTRVHIFHLKAAGRQNWGKMPQAIARIQAARAEGQQVAADVYPYINNGLGVAAFIHPKHATRGAAALVKSLDDATLRTQIRREMETDFSYENWYRHIGFDWDRVVLGGFQKEPYAAHNGKSLAGIAAALEKDPWDVFFDAVRVGAFALPQSMSETNLIRAMRQEFISFCTDVGPAGGSRISSHPRANGAFPRILSRYVREQGVLSLEQAVSQMTSLAANEVYQYDRGRLAPGLWADLVVFDEQRVVDRATLADPGLSSEGIRHVVVNGQIVLRDGQLTGLRPGRALRRLSQ